MAELKDREKELNSMSASQHKQLLAWERDRQRMLALEQRSARLNGEGAGNAEGCTTEIWSADEWGFFFEGETVDLLLFSRRGAAEA